LKLDLPKKKLTVRHNKGRALRGATLNMNKLDKLCLGFSKSLSPVNARRNADTH